MLQFLLFAGYWSLSSQPSFNISTVVIDAGHGGHDAGTSGATYLEKEVALAIAKRVGAKIDTMAPHVSICYTRTDDTFVALYERIGIANRKNADLFLSIHCNSSPRKEVKGTETFVMGLHRADENLAVAQRENEVILLENDYETNYEGYDPNSPVGHIVLSSFQNAYLAASVEVASNIEKQFKDRGFTTSRGVKQAGFAVLRRATMPAMLVETGFLSNKEEEAYLGSDKGQDEISQAIVDAIAPYLLAYNNSHVVMQSPVVKPTTEVPNIPTNLNEAPTRGLAVQFIAVKNKIDIPPDHAIRKLGRLEVVYENNYYKYRIGSLSNKVEASSVIKALDKLGYKGAYLVDNG